MCAESTGRGIFWFFVLFLSAPGFYMSHVHSKDCVRLGGLDVAASEVNIVEKWSIKGEKSFFFTQSF